MADKTILVVDDDEPGRRLAGALLGYAGHRILESSGGPQALELARRYRPDLVLSDILMPVMDGFDLVRRMKSDPSMADIPVILYSATFLEKETQELAAMMGVRHVLTKPFDPQHLWETVTAVLAESARRRGLQFPSSDPRSILPGVGSEGVEEAGAGPPAAASLAEVGLTLSGERDPVRFLERYCDEAAGILRSDFSGAAFLGPDDRTLDPCVARRRCPGPSALSSAPLSESCLRPMIEAEEPTRIADVASCPSLEITGSHPPVAGFLALPVIPPGGPRGLLYFAGGPAGWTPDRAAEAAALTMASRLSGLYGNAAFVGKVQRQAARLRIQVMEHERQQAALRERARMAGFSEEVLAALACGEPVAEALRRCCEAMVSHLDAALGRIWLLDDAGTSLLLRASAGLDTSLDGPHSRVAVGSLEIGAIARERSPHITHLVMGEPRFPDQDWARREGIAAFAGCPLLAGGAVLGVIALFFRQPLAGAAMEALQAAARSIASYVAVTRPNARPGSSIGARDPS